MHDIDDSFRKRREAVGQRRARARRRRVFAGLAVLGVAGIALGFYLTADKWSIDLDDDLVAVEIEDDAGATDIPVYVPAVVDLAGDPMTITIGREVDGVARVRAVPRPADLVDAGISDQLSILSDTMLSTSQSLMTTIPSSPEDFAFFQAQRTARPADLVLPDEPAPAPVEAAPPAAADGAPIDEDAAFSDPSAGWGETIDEGEETLPEFRKTKIENNTMVVTVAPEQERGARTQDYVDKVLGPRSLDSLALEHRFPAEEATRAAEALKTLFKIEKLDAGYVVAMRGLMTGAKPAAQTLVQLSVYADAKYIGTIARADDGSFVSGVDPWVKEDLLHYSGAETQTGPERQYRLLDAIYSTAARNNVPTAVIGETIMYLSRGQDLNAFAAHGDRLLLVYSATPRATDGSAGRVLYAAIRSEQKSLECFVYRPPGADDFACVSEQDQIHSVTVSNGMVTPVNGVMTSTFGPRKHPILGVVRVHKGVDWAAPVGTPIFAAFDGTIAYAGDGKGYGNVVRISHAGGRETRYAHMSRFADNLKVGQQVKAGDVVGYVGTTGLSTGPHLHFELYAGAQAIDPLQAAVAVAEASSGSGDAEVELLVDRIVRVESGGSATAKNPLSSATGLGQFISSTWLRMMRTYRPDLARSLSQADLLALRFDPTISREMVRRLAQEGEAYLRARGHQITAGRLYLCHFLGMEGAHLALSSPDGATVAAVMGGAVMSANPFLNGKTIADLKDWAERKMRGKGAKALPNSPSAPATVTKNVAQASPQFVAFKAALAKLVLAAADGSGAPSPDLATAPAAPDATPPADPAPAPADAPAAPDGGPDAPD